MFANTIDPSVGFAPGLMPLAMWMAIPAAVLAAFLERPFFTRAGVKEHALSHALKANFLSLMIGLLSLQLLHTSDFSPYWAFGSLAAVGLSIGAEGMYLAWRAIEKPGFLRWGWVVSGNMLSAAVLLAIPIAAIAICRAEPGLQPHIERLEKPLLWAGVGVGAFLFFGAIAYPAHIRWRRAGSPSTDRPGPPEQREAEGSSLP